MKRFGALLGILWLLACAGNALPCLGVDGCVAADSCCESEGADHGRCPTGADCPCCPQLRPAPPTVEIALTAPAEYQVAPLPMMAEQHSSPDPREILHVPKLAASFG